MISCKAEDKARYGVMPDLFDADGMNAAILLVEAIKATNGDTTGAAHDCCHGRHDL